MYKKGFFSLLLTLKNFYQKLHSKMNPTERITHFISISNYHFQIYSIKYLRVKISNLLQLYRKIKTIIKNSYNPLLFSFPSVRKIANLKKVTIVRLRSFNYQFFHIKLCKILSVVIDYELLDVALPHKKCLVLIS